MECNIKNNNYRGPSNGKRENSSFSPFFIKMIDKKDSMKNRFQVISADNQSDTRFDIVIMDTCVDTDKLPWLVFQEFLSGFRIHSLHTSPLALPKQVLFKVMPVCFDHLRRTQASKIEMFKLSEYDGIALDLPKTIVRVHMGTMGTYMGEKTEKFEFDCAKLRQKLSSSSSSDSADLPVKLFRRSLSNKTFVIWPDYSDWAFHGPTNSKKKTLIKRLKWNELFRQAVYFIPELDHDKLNNNATVTIELKLLYNLSSDQNTEDVFKFSHIVSYSN